MEADALIGFRRTAWRILRTAIPILYTTGMIIIRHTERADLTVDPYLRRLRFAGSSFGMAWAGM